MNSLIYTPLVLSLLFVTIQLANLSPYNYNKSLKKNRTPASVEFEEIKTNLRNLPMKLGDKVNTLRTRATNLESKQEEFQLLFKSCSDDGGGKDCYLILEAQDLIKSDLTKVNLQLEEALEEEVSRIKNTGLTTLPLEECQSRAFRPDPYDPVKVINLNFHFPVMNDIFSPGMFVENHDGLGNTNYTVFNHIDHLLLKTNQNLEQNFSQKSEEHAHHPVLPIKFLVRKNRHHLPRINRNPNPEIKFQKYYHFSSNQRGDFLDEIQAVKDASVFPLTQDGINLVFLEQLGAPEWLPPVYALNESGQRMATVTEGQLLEEFARFKIRNGNVIEKRLPLSSPPLVIMANEWMGYVVHQKIWNNRQSEKTNSVQSKNFDPWDRGKLITEAIGFVGGLNYIWPNSHQIGPNTFISCDDHPTVLSNPWCGPQAGNNVMDTNCHKNAWSPCQLEIVHKNYQTLLKNLLYLPLKSDHVYDHYIPGGLGEVIWDAPHDLIGDLYIGEGTTLKIQCEVSVAGDARIIPQDRVIGLEKVKVR